MFGARNIVEEFGKVIDTALSRRVLSVHDRMNPDLHAFVAEQCGKNGEMMLMPGDAATCTFVNKPRAGAVAWEKTDRAEALKKAAGA